MVTTTGSNTFIGKAVHLVAEDKGIVSTCLSLSSVFSGIWITDQHRPTQNYFFGNVTSDRATSRRCSTKLDGFVSPLSSPWSWLSYWSSLWVERGTPDSTNPKELMVFSPCTGIDECPSLNNILVLIVGGVPIAMPIVLSVTMAIGAGRLAKKQCIVKHFTAIEELAGMDILCSDKTGTLTKNKLEVYDAIVYSEKWSKEELLFHAALSSNMESQDAIDNAIIKHLSDKQRESLKVTEVVANPSVIPCLSSFGLTNSFII